MANIQITEELFVDLCRYHLRDIRDDETAARIAAALDDKLDRMVNRQLYTDSKTAPTAERREAARRLYLDKRGVPKDFRW